MDALEYVVASGVSLTAAAVVLGRKRDTIAGWAAAAGYRSVLGRRGGLRPRLSVPPDVLPSPVMSDRSSNGRRLTLYERTVIEVLLARGCTRAQIAAEIGFHPSTVTREVNAHRGVNGYFAQRAQARAQASRRRPKVAKLEDNRELRRIVIDCLNKRFSPHQVVLHLRQTFPDRGDLRVSHETVYQALYVQGRGTLRDELRLVKALRSGRSTRIPRSRFAKHRAGADWVKDFNIRTRPPEVADRAVPGHWEGDLVVGTRNQSAIITLAERTSRYTLIRRLPDTHDTASVIPALIDMMSDLPADLKKTLTWDQGSELADHRTFSAATDIKVYFCDPHSPWQRGTNENTNGLIRDFFPKGTNFRQVPDSAISEAQYLLNIRPRATLGGLTPAAKLEQILTHALTT